MIGIDRRPERIRYEASGPATVMQGERPARSIAEGPVAVRFASSGFDAQWSSEKGTLLELAEAAGLHPTYGCRAGVCGSCATRLACGSVDYLQEPVGPHGADEVGWTMAWAWRSSA